MTRRAVPHVDAVILDLDDTLYPQSAFLSAAWDAVADVAARHGAPRLLVREALSMAAAGGSDKGGIIDRALTPWPDVPIPPLLDAFLTSTPPRLPLYPHAADALHRLRERVPVALVSDGDVPLQRAKLAALRLGGGFDVIVWTDLWGRAMRKPQPFGFLLAAAHLQTPRARIAVIGDRPDKDVAGAVSCGMLAVRVRTGEYSPEPSPNETWLTAPTFADAVSDLVKHLPRRSRRHQIERGGLEHDELARVP
jgi:FMN phosphatase YigB (HAD superfamily)